MTYVVDWNNVCLVCLQKCENRSIFEKEDETNLSIADKIMKCSDLQIIEGSHQPNNICVLCLQDLNTAYKFRQNCEQSNSIITAILSKDNRELEVSGLRIKIPSGLKVRKIYPKSSEKNEEPLDENILNEELIKQEDDDGENSDNFDSTDYLVNTEILDDVDEKDQGEKFEMTLEDIEKMDLAPMQEIRSIRSSRSTKTIVSDESQPKRSRGRHKKIATNRTLESNQSLGKCFGKKHKDTSESKPQKICEICGNSYKYQHALNSHMRRHRNERPFNCEFCEKAFVSAVELRRHMRVHTGQKPYECQYCDRRFSDYGSRIKHERTHTGERPYACSTCGKTFAYAHVLTVHMRTHTGEKKYLCSLCGRGFTKKAYLDNHMIHHNKRTIGDDPYETNEATATIVKENQENYIDYVTMHEVPDQSIKPKEEHFDDVMIQEEFQAIQHVAVP